MNKKKNNTLNETIINGHRIYVENGEVKTQLSEEVQKSGFMTVEEARAFLHQYVNKLEDNYGKSKI